MYTQDAKRHVHVPGCTHRALSALLVYTALFKAPVLRYTPAKRISLSALAPTHLGEGATHDTHVPVTKPADITVIKKKIRLTPGHAVLALDGSRSLASG